MLLLLTGGALWFTSTAFGEFTLSLGAAAASVVGAFLAGIRQ